MKIHHYTSIETLEMILKNKSIKFNRLDQVDDKAEYKYDSTVYDTNIKLGKYTFVSCWTKSEMENIDLWNRYGKGNKGVRISLDEDMFETYDVGTVNRSFYNNREYCFENFVVSSYINKVGLVDVKYEQILSYIIKKLSNALIKELRLNMIILAFIRKGNGDYRMKAVSLFMHNRLNRL